MGQASSRVELVVAFLEGLGPGWIGIMTPVDGTPAGQLVLGTGPDIEADHSPLAMFDTIWFSKKSHADLVFDQCFTVLGADAGAPIPRPGAEIRDCIVNVSADLGASWQSTADVVASAGREVDLIERQIEALKAAGGLKQLNSGYKAYRLAMQGTGEAAINYGAYLHSFKVRVAALIGRNVAAGAGRYDGVSVMVASFDNGLRDAKRAQSRLKNVAYTPADQVHHVPLHHTRNDVHKQRRLKT